MQEQSDDAPNIATRIFYLPGVATKKNPASYDKISKRDDLTGIYTW